MPGTYTKFQVTNLYMVQKLTYKTSLWNWSIMLNHINAWYLHKVSNYKFMYGPICVSHASQNWQTIVRFCFFLSYLITTVFKGTLKKEFLICCESFCRRSSVFTLTDLNHGFGGPWKILWIFLLNYTFGVLGGLNWVNFVHIVVECPFSKSTRYL